MGFCISSSTKGAEPRGLEARGNYEKGRKTVQVGGKKSSKSKSLESQR